MRRQFERVKDHITRINRRFGSRALRPLGGSQGIFLGVEFDSALLASGKIHSSSELEVMLLDMAGIDSVALDRTGSARLGFRLNTFSPRKAVGQENPELLEELFDRIGDFIKRVSLV